MSQITSTCDVTNGSALVSFPSGTNLSTIVAGNIVIVGTDTTHYYVGSVNDGADTITLTGNYTGTTASTGSGTGTTVVIHNSFTIDGIPYPEAGDTRNISVIKASINKIQELYTNINSGDIYYDSILSIGKNTFESWHADWSVLQVGGNSSLAAEQAETVNQSSYLIQNAYYDGAWKYVSTDEACLIQQNTGNNIFL